MPTDCIFCKIVRRELPAVRVFEDELALAFMDIAPIIKGHVLVIPKEHYDPLMAVPDMLLQHLILVARRIAQAQKDGLRADGVNLMQANGAAAGQVVPHMHFHVIPRFANDGHHWNWRATKYANQAEMEQFAQQMRARL